MDPRCEPPVAGPSPVDVHRIHDRYLLEIVEALGLCPFARHSREVGRVHRPLVWTEQGAMTPSFAAECVRRTIDAHPDAEIILLTFVDRPGRFADPKTFEAFCQRTRDDFTEAAGPTFFMVPFHPRSGEDLPTDRPLTKDMLVPLIRRSPDPVIQCVNADVLARVRAQAQKAARKRMLETVGRKDPRLRALLENSIQTDSELSADIARANFDAVGQGGGRQELERRLHSIHAARRESYGF